MDRYRAAFEQLWSAADTRAAVQSIPSDALRGLFDELVRNGGRQRGTSLMVSYVSGGNNWVVRKFITTDPVVQLWCLATGDDPRIVHAEIMVGHIHRSPPAEQSRSLAVDKSASSSDEGFRSCTLRTTTFDVFYSPSVVNRDTSIMFASRQWLDPFLPLWLADEVYALMEVCQGGFMPTQVIQYLEQLGLSPDTLTVILVAQVRHMIACQRIFLRECVSAGSSEETIQHAKVAHKRDDLAQTEFTTRPWAYGLTNMMVLEDRVHWRHPRWYDRILQTLTQRTAASASAGPFLYATTGDTPQKEAASRTKKQVKRKFETESKRKPDEPSGEWFGTAWRHLLTRDIALPLDTEPESGARRHLRCMVVTQYNQYVGHMYLYAGAELNGKHTRVLYVDGVRPAPWAVVANKASMTDQLCYALSHYITSNKLGKIFSTVYFVRPTLLSMEGYTVSAVDDQDFSYDIGAFTELYSGPDPIHTCHLSIQRDRKTRFNGDTYRQDRVFTPSDKIASLNQAWEDDALTPPLAWRPNARRIVPLIPAPQPPMDQPAQSVVPDQPMLPTNPTPVFIPPRTSSVNLDMNTITDFIDLRNV